MAGKSKPPVVERTGEDRQPRLFTAVEVVAKHLEWKDSAFIVHDEEGPTVSEAYGAGYGYLAEAVDMSLDDAKRERQAQFQSRVEEAVQGVELPFLAEVENLLEQITRRVAPGPTHHGKPLSVGREDVAIVKSDVESLAEKALALIRTQPSILLSRSEGEARS